MGNLLSLCSDGESPVDHEVKFLEKQIQQMVDKYYPVLAEVCLTNHKLETNKAEIARLNMAINKLASDNKSLTEQYDTSYDVDVSSCLIRIKELRKRIDDLTQECTDLHNLNGDLQSLLNSSKET